MRSLSVAACLCQRRYREITVQAMGEEALRQWPKWNPGEMYYYDIFLEESGIEF